MMKYSKSIVDECYNNFDFYNYEQNTNDTTSRKSKFVIDIHDNKQFESNHKT